MAIVRLWTFQSASIVPRLEAGCRHLAQRLPDGHNLRPAYDWMTERLGKALNVPCEAPPVWCWHSCGRWRRGHAGVGCAGWHDALEFILGLEPPLGHNDHAQAAAAQQALGSVRVLPSISVPAPRRRRSGGHSMDRTDMGSIGRAAGGSW